jgi:hypothetical protein
MHRRNLILRRFGALSFGIGYFDDGVWVDHFGPNGTAGQAAGGAAAQPDEVALDAVHQWYACCGDPAAPEPAVTGWDLGVLPGGREGEHLTSLLET